MRRYTPTFIPFDKKVAMLKSDDSNLPVDKQLKYWLMNNFIATPGTNESSLTGIVRSTIEFELSELATFDLKARDHVIKRITELKENLCKFLDGRCRHIELMHAKEERLKQLEKKNE